MECITMEMRNQKATHTIKELQNKKELKDQARQLQPCVRVGKSGITANLITEIEKQFKHNRLIKIKLLGAVLENIERKKVGDELAAKAKCYHIQTIGNCVVLYKR